jgi:hypothetical protein
VRVVLQLLTFDTLSVPLFALQLLTRNTKERMEFVHKMRDLNFFKGIDWEKLEKRQVKSPLRPKSNLELEISNTIVLSTSHVDDFIGYTFAENRTFKTQDNQKKSDM